MFGGFGAGSTRAYETSDHRVRRIQKAHAYKKGVEDFRSRQRPFDVNQENKEAQVFVRARPLFEHEFERGEWSSVSETEHGVVLHEGCEKIKVRRGLSMTLRHHQYEGLHLLKADEDVYSAVQPLVTRVIQNGSLATLFMFGMTGAGKTYNMNLIHKRVGVDLFEDSDCVKFMAYELVGKKVRDLQTENKEEVHIRVGEDGKSSVCGAKVHISKDAADLSECLTAAANNRETAATGANATSSRSHAVYHLSLENGGTLLLIDLAGNEGVIETHYHSKERMQEAAEINTSLSTLKACLQARASHAAHIPFRESILTRVLRDSLVDEDSTTVMIACVSPACSHFEHSFGTLNAATHLMGNMNRVPVDEEFVSEITVRKGGPKTWSTEQLAAWIIDRGHDAEKFNLNDMNGAQILKMSRSRLTIVCLEDKEMAQDIFVGLREETKKSILSRP